MSSQIGQLKSNIARAWESAISSNVGSQDSHFRFSGFRFQVLALDELFDPRT